MIAGASTPPDAGRTLSVVTPKTWPDRAAAAVLAATLLAPVPVAAKDVEVPFKLERRSGVIVVDVKVNDRAARLLLDTGAARTVIRPELVGVNPMELRVARFSGQGPGLGG